MENKIRQGLADQIAELLLTDENAGISLWKEKSETIRLQQEGLPLVEVLSCVYNAADYVANAIESVLNQTYPNLRFVIVSDGCTDRTTEIIQEYAAKYSNIHLIVNPENYGIIQSANIGLEVCKSDFIARMDLDDLIHPMRIEKQMAFLKDFPDIGAVSSYMKIFNENHEINEVMFRENYDLQKITMLFYSPLSHAATLFRTNVIKGIGYKEGYKYAEDYDLWFRIMCQYKTAVYPEYLYYYRTHSNQVTNQRNIDIIKSTWVMILANIFDKLKLNYTQDDIQFHIKYCTFNHSISSLEEWLEFHAWLNKIVESNQVSGFFNQEVLKSFLFMNYWMTGFNQFKSQMSLRQFNRVINCPLNPLSLFGKYKLIAKQLIGR
jgi:glycosyltransferase involved in cell wall biosynthesis